MDRPSNVEIEVHLEETGAPAEMFDEVRDSLGQSPKRLSSKYFYDSIGSRLFERITTLPEYYLTRSEESILTKHGHEIASLTRCEELVELGSGAANKTRLLIEAGMAEGSLRRYIPVEVSRSIAERSAREIGERYPQLGVHALVGDFESHLEQVPDGGRRMFAFLGSTIGNFSLQLAIDFLATISREMRGQDWLLLGTDLLKDRATMEAAYNDSQGVTALFTKNILSVINRHLDGDFDPNCFEHVAFFNEEHSRMEAHLRSKKKQRVHLAAIDLEVSFDRDELLGVEVSCKYTQESVRAMLDQAGLRLRRWFEAEDSSFAVSLAALV